MQPYPHGEHEFPRLDRGIHPGVAAKPGLFANLLLNFGLTPPFEDIGSGLEDLFWNSIAVQQFFL